MSKQLTLDDARQSLTAHVAARAYELRQKYGPHIGWNELLHILDDRDFVRYPCSIEFDAAPLQAGECACAIPSGKTPEEGFTIFVHPLFSLQLQHLPHLVLYQLVVVNYGEFASPDDAETFGAGVLGIPREDYYQSLCGLADELGAAGCD